MRWLTPLTDMPSGLGAIAFSIGLRGSGVAWRTLAIVQRDDPMRELKPSNLQMSITGRCLRPSEEGTLVEDIAIPIEVRLYHTREKVSLPRAVDYPDK